VSRLFSTAEYDNHDGTYLVVIKCHRIHSPSASSRAFSQKRQVLTEVCLAERVQAKANTEIRPNVRRDSFAFTQYIGHYTSTYPTPGRLVELRPPDVRNMPEGWCQVLGYGKP
jgi:hypothetical protein